MFSRESEPGLNFMGFGRGGLGAIFDTRDLESNPAVLSRSQKLESFVAAGAHIVKF